MKLTKKREAEILKVYNAYWDSYFKGDMRVFASLLHKNVQLIGSSENEVFSNKRSAMKFYKSTARQVVGKAGLQNRKITVRPVGKNVLVIEQSDFYVLIDNEWSFYGNGRISTLLQKTDKGWKIIHEHGSLPDSKAGEGEQVNTERIKAENRQLREAIKRRTFELEHKNRELEIGAALERVRAVAMGMKQPADMLEICRTISQELALLKVKDIRNVQTAIFYPQRGTYMNYEYYAKHKKTFITETTYTNNRIHKAFALKMLKGEGEFFTTHIKGKKVKDWIAYQKTTNVFIDRYLNTTSSLNYYWYSLGPVAMGISSYSPLTDDGLNLFKRFRNVFELAYRRYTDIEKAERQAREAKIEAALERVRARSMAMHKGDELQEVITLVFKQLHELGLDITSAHININDKAGKQLNLWIANDQNAYVQLMKVPRFDNPIMNLYINAVKNRDPLFTGVFDRKVVEDFFRKMLSLPDFLGISKERKKYLMSVNGYAISGAVNAHTSLAINNYGSKPFSDEENDIVTRFGRVFEQTYIRFLDLRQAEAQAREAQVEAALEKIRSRSLAMHKSDELQEVVRSVFERLNELHIEFYTAIIIIFVEGSRDCVWWLVNKMNQQHSRIVIKYADLPYFRHLFKARETKKEFFSACYSGGDKRQLYEYLLEHTDFRYIPEEQKRFLLESEFASITVAFTKNVGIHVTRYSEKMLSEDENEVVRRFAQVFDQAYVRFLDLQNAEAQARQAQIEAALERIRASAMAMHTSGEIENVVHILREQMGLLGQPELETSVISLLEENSDHILSWYAFRPPALSSGKIVTGKMSFLWQESALTREMVQAYRSGHKEYIIEADAEKAVEMQRVLVRAEPELAPYVDQRVSDRVWHFLTYFSGGTLLMVSHQPPSEEAKSLQRRAAAVFDLAYRRHRDLKNAEAQVREAQIEAALERVRSRTMGMQKSEELKEVIQIVYEQFVHLNVHIEHTGFVLDYKARNDYNIWIADHLGSPANVIIPYFDSVYYNLFNEAKEKSLDFFAANLSFEAKNTFYHDLFKHLPGFPEESKAFILGKPALTISTALLDNVALYIENFSGFPYSDEENAILMRFGRVFQQTYTRFLDLQKAEAQAREAQIELSLERIRAKVTAMKESSELLDIVVTMRSEFVALGHEAHYFWHMRWLPDKYEKAMTSGDGTRIGMVMELPRHIHGDIPLLADWEEGKEPAVTFAMDVETAVAYVDKMIRLGDFKQVDPQAPTLDDIRHIGGLTFIMARTTHGEIGFSLPGTVTAPPQEAVETLVRFAGVFDLAYRRFEDLKSAEARARQAQLDLVLLQEAKKKAEDALTELRATQEQLLQQEKLASLGQLTAGIAHEIKNPLNFVNNFSSVSVELVDEAMEEIKKLTGGDGDVQQLLDDVKKNLSKIIEHGTRADGIVKSMLQHSRGGTGKREPTDLNALVKEYANLAFHGMRAGKNPINVDIVLELDPSVGTVPLIAEDFSRVIINLCQNAFDAMREKQMSEVGNRKSGQYLPRLAVRTRRDGDKIVVEVEDNGPGIPDAIKDKILQPFFTTKKGTQGTGLGLSITHDIVKAHGGEMRIENNEYGGAMCVVTLQG